MEKHGLNILQQATSLSTPTVATSGIPFVIGTAPVQAASSPANVGVPILCRTWDEAVSQFGYSENWTNYTLCEAMYSHFQIFEMQPAIFCNVSDTSTMKTAVAAADMDVADHKVTLPFEAVNDDTLIVMDAGGTGTAYVKDTDYTVYYDSGNLIIELLPDGAIYTSASLNVAYSEVNPSAVTSTAIATGLEAVDKTLTMTGVIPDIIIAPGFSQDASVAAVMAAKSEKICGLYGGKALIDMDTTTVTDYSQVLNAKTTMNAVDKNQILCWPMLKLGDRIFHMSTLLAGLMAVVDNENSGVPYESPSNKSFRCDAAVLADGTEVGLTYSQANVLNFGGVVTALGTLNGLVCWGNYTACYPGNADPKDHFIPISRMFDWVGNTIINTYWNRIDAPFTRRLIDSIMDTLNIWLNGITRSGYLLGGSVSFRAEENPEADLIAGILRFHVLLTPPGPAQQMDFILEYDASIVAAVLAA